MGLHDDKSTRLGRSKESRFEKICFRDGGFFLGIAHNNIPHGLGIFFYPDQKFDCGFYMVMNI